MIRQAISCDICGAEKKQTNHWFVASEQAGELRVSGWSSRNKLRTGTKHLCGQTCLHKLVDEFMARTISGRISPPAADNALASEVLSDTDASLTSKAAYAVPEPEISPLPKPAALVPMRPVLAAATIAVPMQPRPPVVDPRPLPPAPCIEEEPNYTSRRWRAEAWERERERELHAVDRRTDVPRHRKTF